MGEITHKKDVQICIERCALLLDMEKECGCIPYYQPCFHFIEYNDLTDQCISPHYIELITQADIVVGCDFSMVKGNDISRLYEAIQSGGISLGFSQKIGTSLSCLPLNGIYQDLVNKISLDDFLIPIINPTIIKGFIGVDSADIFSVFRGLNLARIELASFVISNDDLELAAQMLKVENYLEVSKSKEPYSMLAIIDWSYDSTLEMVEAIGSCCRLLPLSHSYFVLAVPMLHLDTQKLYLYTMVKN
ncbi:MAG TPA: hypothetical protein DEV85_01000 [Vibrio sp.]|uniref:hypothetical protein n=1 Tax=Vibrio sp. TaxID=678 RepID=UPI000ECD9D85|nr:hypothetical protein [Vibrio sp.]HCH00455.1 hypothetical protein [Vibrio sp.]